MLMILLGCTVIGFIVMTSSIQATAPAADLSQQQPPGAAIIEAAPKLSDASSASGATTIAYAVSVTGCGTDPLSEGAAVLAHSIHQASVRQKGSNARYDYKMYAIVHPDGMKCGSQLAELGYTVLQRETPVAVKDIEGEFLRTHIEANG